jgi:hypothetical protein
MHFQVITASTEVPVADFTASPRTIYASRKEFGYVLNLVIGKVSWLVMSFPGLQLLIYTPSQRYKGVDRHLIRMSLDELKEFWDRPKHDGEPGHWTNDELRQWLQRHKGQAASLTRNVGRADLVNRVAAELDHLYEAYRPSFIYKYSPMSPESLFCWAPPGRTSEPDSPMVRMVREAGSLERKFNSMFNLPELMQNIGRTMPMGRFPHDDLRQNLIIAAQVYDRGSSSILFQSYEQDEALTVSIRRAVLLIPQRKFKEGDKVIIILPASVDPTRSKTQSSTKQTTSAKSSSSNSSSKVTSSKGISSSNSGSYTGEVQQTLAGLGGGAKGTVTQGQKGDSRSMVSVLLEGRNQPVQVTCWHSN